MARDIALFGLTAGRLMADTYLAARYIHTYIPTYIPTNKEIKQSYTPTYLPTYREHLRETTYSLTHLATTQLRLPHPRAQIDPMQVGMYVGR